MKIIPRDGYVLVSKQEIAQKKKPGRLLLTSDEKPKVYLRVESNGEIYEEDDCVFANPFCTKLEIEENLFLMEEKDIVALIHLEDENG